ncbi:MAG: hypothetical protein Tsb0019_34440 [Roseibium sp.]
MEFMRTIGPVLIAVSLLCGLFGYAAYDNWRKKGPLAEEAVTSNAGSIMMYLVWLACISVTGTLAVALVKASATLGFTPEQGLAIYLAGASVVVFLLGALYARVNLMRARDSGRSRGSALLGLVPLANFWLMFAPPKPAPERPPYVPQAVWARVAIGLAAAAVLFSHDYFTDYVNMRLSAVRAGEHAGLAVFRSHTVPPEDLAGKSELLNIKTQPADRMIVYSYLLSGATIDRERLQNWVKDTMAPETAKLWCGDPWITKRDWTVWYEYYDKEPDEYESPIADAYFSRGSCPKLGSEGVSVD